MGKRKDVQGTAESLVQLQQIRKEVLENDPYYKPWDPTYQCNTQAVLIGCNQPCF